MVEGSEKLMKLSACKDKVMHRVDAGPAERQKSEL